MENGQNSSRYRRKREFRMDQMHNQGPRSKRFEGINKEQKIHKHGWSRGPAGREITNNAGEADCYQIMRSWRVELRSLNPFLPVTRKEPSLPSSLSGGYKFYLGSIASLLNTAFPAPV